MEFFMKLFEGGLYGKYIEKALDLTKAAIEQMKRVVLQD